MRCAKREQAANSGRGPRPLFPFCVLLLLAPACQAQEAEIRLIIHTYEKPVGADDTALA